MNCLNMTTMTTHQVQIGWSRARRITVGGEGQGASLQEEEDATKHAEDELDRWNKWIDTR